MMLGNIPDQRRLYAEGNQITVIRFGAISKRRTAVWRQSGPHRRNASCASSALSSAIDPVDRAEATAPTSIRTLLFAVETMSRRDSHRRRRPTGLKRFMVPSSIVVNAERALFAAKRVFRFMAVGKRPRLPARRHRRASEGA